MENKNFCIKPFNSVNINTDGNINTCCRIQPKLSKFKGDSKFYNLKKDTVKSFWNSDYLKHLQGEFSNEQRPSECQSCWSDEKKNFKSERQWANNHYKIIGNKKPEYYLKHLKKENLPYPEDYNLNISNLCNLKCYMCGGKDSSKLLVENVNLGIEDVKQKDFDIPIEKVVEMINEMLKNKVTNITLQGGEPLMNPKIISLLKNLAGKKDFAKNISVWITTNGTQYSPLILNTLQKFKTVKIIFSIDGIGKVNDYMRYPSQWNVIENNVKNYLNLKNASFQITYTIQNLNLLYIKKMIDFCQEMKIYLKFNLLTTPSYLKLNVLPEQTLLLAGKIISKLPNDIIHVENLQGIKNLVNQALERQDTDQDLEVFKKIMKKRDAYRKISMKNYLPELAEHLNI